MALSLKNLGQRLLDSTTIDEKISDFFRPKTGKLATAGRNWAQELGSKQVSVPRPIAQTASRLASATPRKIVSQGLLDNQPLQRFAQAGLGQYKSPTISRIAQRPLTSTQRKVADVPLSALRGAAQGAGGFTGSENLLRKAGFGTILDYQPQTTAGKIANFGGGLAGFAAGPGKIISPLEAAVVARTPALKGTSLLAKAGRKAIPGILAESATSAVLSPLQAVSEGKSIQEAFGEQLSGGLAGRAAFGSLPILAGLTSSGVDKELRAALKSAPGIESLVRRFREFDFLDLTKQLDEKPKLFNLTKSLLEEVSPSTAKTFRKLAEKDPDLYIKQARAVLEDRLATARDPNLSIGLQAKELKKLDNTFNPNKYISEQVSKQDIKTGKLPLSTKADQTLQAIKTKFEDFTTPIETALNRAEKEGNFKILPAQDLRYQIDKVLRADSLGTQFIKDNGLERVIRETDNLDNLNQYLIAKQATDVSGRGIKTGRDLKKDKQLIQSLSDKYEPIAQQIYSYNANLRKYLVDSGLISQDLSNKLAKTNPNYVPLKRLFSETEEAALRQSSGRGGPASIGSQNVVKKLKGSERQIVNPLESLLENTAIAFREGERNKGATMLGRYIENGIISGKEIKGNIGPKHTVSFLDNGKKRVFEVSPEIATAAKNLNADQLSKALKIISVPTRILQMGATGFNVPFIAGNLAKDQVTAAVISQKPLSTSIINPKNFVKALFSSIKQDALYDNWVRSGSSFTSFDIARGSAPNTIKSIRSNRSAGSKVKYLVTNPSQLFRALEDVIGTTENLTRIQQYAGTKNALMAEGRNAIDADILAGAASRTNTANFARKGEYGKVLNAVIPFFNAGIQGARSLRQSFVKDPKGTSLRFAATVGIPAATATLWNIGNYERKAAYEDIPDYEKENNIIILPEKPVKDKDGNYDAIKIPITPGMSNIMSIMRRQLEGVGANPQEALKILSDLSAAGTSMELPIDSDSARQLAGQITPQAIKLMLEPTLNKNFFTGADIVPSYLSKKPPAEQVRDNTSGTARLIGNKLNVSPLKVENTISSGGAGTGKQLLNLSDTLLAKSGKIPAEQVGGRSISEDLKRRFAQVKGDQKINDMYEAGLTKKQIDSLLKQEKENTAKFSGSRERSPEAPKTIMDKISLASKAITKDPKNTIKAIFTEEVMRKITNDTLIFERKTNINPGKEGYHVDHTIPLSLGGDNSPENLVVYEKEAKAKKDKLEAELWRKLDKGEITGKEAREQIQAFIDENGAGTPLSNNSKEYVDSVAKGEDDVVIIPSVPKYGDNAELNKELKSKYSRQLSSAKSKVIKLYEEGKITEEEAVAKLKEIADLKSKSSSKTGSTKSKKKITIKQTKSKPVTFKLSKTPQVAITAPKVNITRPTLRGYKVPTIRV